MALMGLMLARSMLPFPRLDLCMLGNVSVQLLVAGMVSVPYAQSKPANVPCAQHCYTFMKT